MRTVIKCLVLLLAAIGFIGLLGASVSPLSVADEEADDDGPSFYASAKRHPVRLPTTAIGVQIELLKRARG
ncbi:MAG: hypothetical protein HYV03_03495 [Deltaproteobacteria bacterium]|nr:hypothetical protein [Deltaproteobacteria bacterium]